MFNGFLSIVGGVAVGYSLWATKGSPIREVISADEISRKFSYLFGFYGAICFFLGASASIYGIRKRIWQYKVLMLTWCVLILFNVCLLAISFANKLNLNQSVHKLWENKDNKHQRIQLQKRFNCSSTEPASVRNAGAKALSISCEIKLQEQLDTYTFQVLVMSGLLLTLLGIQLVYSWKIFSWNTKAKRNGSWKSETAIETINAED